MVRMVEAGLSIAGTTSILGHAGSDRLRPARPEQGVAPLLWEGDALALPLPPGLLGHMTGLPSAAAWYSFIW